MKQALKQHKINDEFYTPVSAVLPLIRHLPKNITIWECTDFGASNITKVLRHFGYNVVTTHKKNFDFLRDVPNFSFDFIITNPPFSLKDAFLDKCYRYNKPFALLLPITALEGIYRNMLYRKFGLQLLVIDKRINFMDNKKTCWFNTSWFCWHILEQDLMFESLDDYEQLTLF